MSADSEQFQSWEDAVSWLIDQTEQRELVESCYFDRPALAAAERFLISPEWGALREFLPSSAGEALDVGSGMGISAYALAKDGWKTTALEPDGSALVGAAAIRSLAREGGVNISVEEEWGEKLPFTDDSFDLVHARQVLHHAFDLGQFCKELHRVVRPGGVLVTTRDHVVSNSKQLSQFLASHPLHKIYGGENAFTAKEYREALIGAGFRIKLALRPFDSVVNYAPYTEDTLCTELLRRASKVPCGRFVARFLLTRHLRSLTLRSLSLLDFRPGRLFSFICIKEGLEF